MDEYQNLTSQVAATLLAGSPLGHAEAQVNLAVAIARQIVDGAAPAADHAAPAPRRKTG